MAGYLVEPTNGIEPLNLFLTKEALYRLSYVGYLLRCYGTLFNFLSWIK